MRRSNEPLRAVTLSQNATLGVAGKKATRKRTVDCLQPTDKKSPEAAESLMASRCAKIADGIRAQLNEQSVIRINRYAADPEKYRAKSRAYYAAHRERINARRRTPTA